MNNQRKDWSRRDFLHASAAGSWGMLLPAGLASRAAEEEPAKRPNVLLIFCDQMRRDASTVYGGRNIPTPGLERMAREGMTFDNALCTCPLCTPYRGMLMTGRYGTHSGIVVNRIEVNTRQTCLGQFFRDAGYHTGYIGKWHLTAGDLKTIGRNPDHPEFVPPGELRLGFDHWQAYNIHDDFRNYWYYEDEPVKIYSEEYQTDAVTSQAIQFMDHHRDSAEPFFLAVSPHPPHPPSARAMPAGYLEQIPTKTLLVAKRV
jgi:arylsulfatase A-like enzyme